MLASSSQVLKELWKRVSDTSISFPLYFLHYYFFLRGRLERRKKYGFPNRKEIWTVVTFPINWPGFSTAPLHRCGIKLVNLDFYVSNFLAFRAVWEPSKRFISNIRNSVAKECFIPFGQFLIFQSMQTLPKLIIKPAYPDHWSGKKLFQLSNDARVSAATN